MSALRAVLGLLLVAAGLWFLVLVFGGDGAAPPAEARTFTSSAECRECHPAVWDEWEGSQHAISWTNPRVQALSNGFANQDCIDCHAPRPVFVTGIGERVLPRTTRRPEGVDCISCHLLPDGRVAGTKTIESAACRPVETLDLSRPELCAGCHNQHQTVDQWRASSWFEKGQDCLDCHMPFRGGDPNAGRDHAFLGGNDLAMLQRAVELTAERTAPGWVVAVANVGAGHAFPTDERSRRADLFWRPLADDRAEGEGGWRHLYRIRDPYRHETDIPRTLVDADQTLRVPLEDPEAVAGPIEVALFYRREPYWADPDRPDPERTATLVHRLELEP